MNRKYENFFDLPNEFNHVLIEFTEYTKQP